MEKFDVLIVYSAKLAFSAGSKKDNVISPFAKGSKNESYNIVYSYFLETCRKNGLKAAFTTSADIIGPGQCEDYWLFEKNKWIRVNRICYSKVIFDKFSPTNSLIKKRRRNLFSAPDIKPFNDPRVYDLFFDKQKTYNKLRLFTMPTVTIKASSYRGIRLALAKLSELIKNHTHNEDFSREIVLKDRFGAGGFDVYKFKIDQIKEISDVLKKHSKKSFIIQPLVKFEKGFTFNNSAVSADIRLIHLDGKIIQTYIRMAKKGDFRCNEHQGGMLKYIPKRLIPDIVITESEKILKSLNKTYSLFALDFIISNNGNVYLLEGNTGPGLDWNLTLRENELEAQRLIRIIVGKLGEMVKDSEPFTSDIFPINYSISETASHPFQQI